MLPKFSIIIAVRTINDYLEENIAHLKKLSYKNFEVLIVTDDKEDYDFFGDERFRLLVSGPKGPGEKRNVGARNAKGQILAFLDDDAFPHRNWLTHAEEIFRNPNVFALGAPAVTPINAPFKEKMAGYVLESYLTGASTVYRHKPGPRRFINDYPTVNLFVRRIVFWNVGGFLTEFWPGEDTKLCLDIVRLFGRKFLYDPKPVVYHHRRQLFSPFLEQISRYGRHRGQFARIFPETSRLPSYFAPMLFTIFLLLSPVACIYFPALCPWVLGVLWLYVLLVSVEALKACLRTISLRAFPYVWIGIFLTHLVYGINFISGLIKKPTLKLRDVDSTTGSYLGG